MAVQTITYNDKQYLNQNSDIADVNKVNDTDMNEIKSVVNNNAVILRGETTYSLNETNTGKTWIDGKPIYRKVIDFGAFPNTNDKYVDLNINDLDFVISLQVLGYDAVNKNYFPIPNALTTGSPNLIDSSIIGNQIRIRTQSDRRTFIAYPIIEYTKTID